MQIATNLYQILEQIENAATAAGRNPDSVRLVAVSKTRPVEDILVAHRAGQTIFGENYVQELVAKASAIKEPLEWHFIGHLQSNKVRQIAPFVSTIHSVDRLSLAEEISRQYKKIDKTCKILIQVNISGETTKSGTTAEDAIGLIRMVATLPSLSVCGLMTIPPFFDEPEGAAPYFAGLKKLSERITQEQIKGVRMDELSMGMSGDFEVAINEGATLVRVGTAIFGERQAKQ